MSPTLKNMLVGVGVFIVGGLGLLVYTPQPATRTMLELKDAGVLDGQPVVLECPERITKQTRRRIDANQPGLLRPGQSYAHIARTARCWNADGGNCVQPATGAVRFSDLNAELVIPSLRRNLQGVDLDAGVFDDGGADTDAVDDSFQYRNDDCMIYGCGQYDALIDAGTRSNPFANRFCGSLNRLAVVPSPCALPNCWVLADGGWDDNAVVDCRFGGPFAELDGGPRWRGCNVGPAQYSAGAACVPVECSVVAGDVPQDWL